MAERPLLAAGALSAHVAAIGRRSPVPLLAFRLIDLERVAWKEGRNAARSLMRRAQRTFLNGVAPRVRAADALAHDPAAEVFLVALLERRSGEMHPVPAECRAILTRAAGAFAAESIGVEGGWTLSGGTDLRDDVRAALTRGAQERQRLDFLSPIAHEMRTPLAAVRGYLETVLESGLDATTSRRFLRIARDEALRLGRLVDGMFAVSLLDTDYGAASNTAECGSPHAAMERALECVLPQWAGRRPRIAHRVLPPHAVRISFDHLVQIFANVVANAIAHGREDGCVAIGGARRGSMLEIVVDDDGPGIPEAEREAVFELGYRTTAAGPGTGFGLAVVRRLLERAGGTVCATTAPLGGARIVMRIPLATG